MNSPRSGAGYAIGTRAASTRASALIALPIFWVRANAASMSDSSAMGQVDQAERAEAPDRPTLGGDKAFGTTTAPEAGMQ